MTAITVPVQTIDSKCLIFPENADFPNPLPKEILDAPDPFTKAQQIFKGCRPTWKVQSIHLPTQTAKKFYDDDDTT